MLVAFMPPVSGQTETLSDNSNIEKISITLGNGTLTLPIDDKGTNNLSSIESDARSATSFLSGTIDDDNHIILKGAIIFDGKKEAIELKGKATKEFIGWDVPENAKPIYCTVGDEKSGYTTITRYEGATERYATILDFIDEDDKYNLHGIFYQDGHGGLAGTLLINKSEYNIVLKGSSTNLYKNVDKVDELKSSQYISVPYRSQWELTIDEDYSYSVASRACGVAASAMLEEFYNGNSPTLGSIWDQYGQMGTSDTEAYLQSKNIDADIRTHDGSLSYVIDCAQYYIDTGRPFFLEEESQWGELHAVILRGYDDSNEYFKLNDPNSLSGASTLYWYESDNPSFNFEENIYEYEGGSDDMSDGMAIVVN